MHLKRISSVRVVAYCLLPVLLLALPAGAQTNPTPGAQPPQATAAPANDPLAELSAENRALFDQMRTAARGGQHVGVYEAGKKLLPALKPGTRLALFVTMMTAESAIETGHAAEGATLLEPVVAADLGNWRMLALLIRAYAESGQKQKRDQQIERMIALHKSSTDEEFTKLHMFPVEDVKLASGSISFLYPFAPLGRHNTQLVGLVFDAEGKQIYRLELESGDADQAFFKAKKPGERRFSIDSYNPGKDKDSFETQALHGFIDGIFDYDTMRDAMVKVARESK